MILHPEGMAETGGTPSEYGEHSLNSGGLRYAPTTGYCLTAPQAGNNHPPRRTARMGAGAFVAVPQVNNLHSFWNFPESWRELIVKTRNQSPIYSSLESHNL